ncbi:cytochrome P450 [Leucosporidium creatinivorum]|uniref:Cytochrome P450 n=1 Tax=Leucosporidium creatinivorum TaxID=106004 RepID=A0A1Y2FHS7_9BASI|nr:cytochrome P450 [Leucosporidium creatinivorum]
MSLSSVFLLLLLVLSALHLVKDCISRLSQYRRSVQLVENCPGLRVLIHPEHWSARWLPRIPGINLGAGYLVGQGHELFSSRGTSDVLSLVSFFPSRRGFIVADPVSARTVLLDDARFQERGAVRGGKANALVDDSIGVTRSPPTLHGWNDQELNEVAVESALKALREVSKEWEAVEGNEGKLVLVRNVVDFALALQLNILAALTFPNSSPTELSSPICATLRQALAKDPSEPSLLTLPALNSFPSSSKLASSDLERHIKKAINVYHSTATSSPKGREKATRRDLISALLETSLEQEVALDDLASLDSSVFEDPRLSDSEVMQITLRMLRGSYEPLSYALATTLLLLALHPEAQAQVHAELDQAMPSGSDLTLNTLKQLPFLNASLMEATRLYPPVVALTRSCTVDTVLSTSPSLTGSHSDNVFVPRGSDVLIDSAALHRNPRFWDEGCDEFNPERFLSAENDQSAAPVDAFVGFGSGRLGEDFASVGILALLASLMLRSSVELNEPVSLSSAAAMDSVVGARTTSALLLKPSGVGLTLRERPGKS